MMCVEKCSLFVFSSVLLLSFDPAMASQGSPLALSRTDVVAAHSVSTAVVDPRILRPAVASVGVMQGTVEQKQRNRILYITTSIAPQDWSEFHTAKFNYLQEASGSGQEFDLHMLSFSKGDASNRGDPAPANRGAFMTINESGAAPEFCKVSDCDAVDPMLIEEFIAQRYVDGRTHLVVGTHGVGGYFSFQYITKDRGASVHEDDMYGEVFYSVDDFCSLLGGRQFLSVTLDACLMSELYTAVTFAKHTPLLVAGQGFMFEEDVDVDKSMFTGHFASALTNCGTDQKDVEQSITAAVQRYTLLSDRGDITMISTSRAADLLRHVQSHDMYSKHFLEWDDKNWFHYDETDPADRPFSPFCFYRVGGDEHTQDTQYLLDLGKLFAYHGDSLGHQLMHQTFIMRTDCRSSTYDFQLSGMSFSIKYWSEHVRQYSPERAVTESLTLALPATVATPTAELQLTPTMTTHPTTDKPIITLLPQLCLNWRNLGTQTTPGTLHFADESVRQQSSAPLLLNIEAIAASTRRHLRRARQVLLVSTPVIFWVAFPPSLS